MRHPSFGRNLATFINLTLILTLAISVFYETSMITSPKIMKEISIPEKELDKQLNKVGNIDTNRIDL